MNKKTKMYIGVGVLAVAAYYFWDKSQKAKSTSTATTETKKQIVGFANAAGTCNRNGEPGWSVRTNSNGVLVCSSPDGMRSYRVSK
jgi:putative hemolysin